MIATRRIVEGLAQALPPQALPPEALPPPCRRSTRHLLRAAGRAAGAQHTANALSWLHNSLNCDTDTSCGRKTTAHACELGW